MSTCVIVYLGPVFMKGLSQVLGLSRLYFYTKVKPKTWLRPFMNTAPGQHPVSYSRDLTQLRQMVQRYSDEYCSEVHHCQ